MGTNARHSRGFTLVASLLLLLLLSAMAVGLMYLVSGTGHVGNNDLESNEAYYGAEAGMEKLTADLATLYTQKLSPSQADLNNLASTSPPTSAQVSGMSYLESVRWTNTDANGNPITSTSVISSGPNAGLMAEIVPITLQVSAFRPSGASVNMTRGVEVALIPVFQFGVFSDSDLSYFAGPKFGFKGRVHTNGNLFLAADSGPLILDAKATAVNQIIRDKLANGFSNGSNYRGSVFVPNQDGGCDSFLNGGSQGSNCIDLGADSSNNTNDASWSNGIPPAGLINNSFPSIAASPFNGFIGNGASASVRPLQLPFVQGATGGTADQQIQIIRKPQTTTESATSPLGSSREYNKANIRILLGTTQAELHPDGSAFDSNDVNLAGNAFAVSGVGTTPVAMASTAIDSRWRAPGTNNALTSWPLVDGWLRVEYRNAAGTWVGVTNEWLGLGFARQFIPPATPLTGNTVHPKAILILQELADRNGDGIQQPLLAPPAGDLPLTVTGANSWYPINFYDPREGFPRDSTTLTGTQCYTNGIMNAVELDVGNLKQWLTGNIAGSGTLVDPTPQNGYLVYFSDRRGMIADPNAQPTPNVTNGESGLEDDINASSANGMPDGALDPVSAGYNAGNGFSPEDVDENGRLDRWGWANISDGFGINPAANPNNPYVQTDCFNVGRQNKVTGARHALRLVDGSLGNLPLPGFTVVSENPLYVLGDYNSRAGDPTWNSTPTDSINPVHSAAAVIADSVTLLSSNWTDRNDMANPVTLTNRNSATTYYRMAISAGKNMNFPRPANTGNDFGTDGGVHNFLRYIEDWGGTTLYYRGSLISLYFSEYATGIFKCCTLVYNPPNRQYYFDTDFLTPTSLPPGTPMLQDIDNLTYWQNFSPCTTQNGMNCSN